MDKKTVLLLYGLLLLITLGLFYFYSQKQNQPTNPLSNLSLEEIKPSETFIDYQDPSGFSFSYPDNLSISKAEIEDSNVYTDLQLYSKDKSGSITLKIADTKYKSMDEWRKANKISSSSASVAKNLGNLKALEVKTPDRLMLGAIDQGVLFTLEMPLIEQEFWNKVYEKVLQNFEFISPDAENSQSGSDSLSDITFEGEEVVE